MEVKTINGYTIKDEKAIRTYDTVALMQADLKLSEGQHVKTRGYYEINDGGESEYYITSILDNSKIQEILSNGLYSELIIKNSEINVKQLGAYGDGTHDDTLFIQNAINHVKNDIITNENYNTINTIVFPGGIYKITNTIETYTFVRLKSLDMTTIISDINDTMIKIKAIENLPYDYYNSYSLAYIIDGSKGFLIKNTGNGDNSIGIELIDNIIPNNRQMSKIIFESVGLLGNNIGCKVNNANMYLIEFNNVNFGNNTIGIQFGDSTNFSQTNSGENIVFNRCMFVNTDAFKFYVSGIDCNLINCSIDFCTNIFNQAKTGGYRKIFINGGHIEGISEKILTSAMLSSEIYIQGVRFFINPNHNYFPTSIPGTYVFINNSSIAFTETSDQSPSSYLFPETNIFIKDCIIGLDKSGKPLGFNKNLVLHNTFDNVPTGEITYSSGGSLGSYTFDGKTNVSTIECIETNIFGNDNVGKLIRITKEDIALNSNFTILSDFIPCITGDKFRLYVAGKNCFKATSCVVKCYDINKTRLQNLTINYNNAGESDNKDEYLFTKHYAQFVIPINTCFIKVEYIFANSNTEVLEYDIGGIFVEKI